MARRQSQRLDLPRGGSGRPALPPDLLGRLAERTARFIGTGRFLVAQTGVLAVWLAANLPGSPVRFDLDGYPLLTLLLSLQAAYAAPLILLAQNRQADRDYVVAARERQDSAELRATVAFLARELTALRAAQAETASRSYLDAALHQHLGAVAALVAPAA